MSRSTTDSSSSFPGWVALASLAVALWLHFANAVPASRERAELRALAGHYEGLRDQYDAAIAETRLARGEHAHQDLQALLVAIDQLGLTPAELCAAHPEKAPYPNAAEEGPEAPPDGDGDGTAEPPPTSEPAPGAPRTKFQ